MRHGTDRQAVIADDFFVCGCDIGLRAAGCLIVQGKTGNVAVEVFVSAVECLGYVGAIKFLYDPACLFCHHEQLSTRFHQAGKARPCAGWRIERCLKRLPLSVIKDEQAAIRQCFGGGCQAAVEQELADRFVLGLSSGLDYFFGGRRDAQVDTLGF